MAQRSTGPQHNPGDLENRYAPQRFELGTVATALNLRADAAPSEVAQSLNNLISAASSMKLSDSLTEALQRIKSAFSPPAPGQFAFTGHISAASPKALEELKSDIRTVSAALAPTGEMPALVMPPPPAEAAAPHMDAIERREALWQNARDFLAKHHVFGPSASSERAPDAALLSPFRLSWTWVRDSWHPSTPSSSRSLFTQSERYLGQFVYDNCAPHEHARRDFTSDLIHLKNRERLLRDVGMSAPAELRKSQYIALYELISTRQ